MTTSSSVRCPCGVDCHENTVHRPASIFKSKAGAVALGFCVGAAAVVAFKIFFPNQNISLKMNSTIPKVTVPPPSQPPSQLRGILEPFRP